MKPTTLRGRVALWSAAVATFALVLFGVAAAWNLRRELTQNLDEQIRDEAADFAEEMNEQQVTSPTGGKTMSFSTEDLPRFVFVEVRGPNQRLLYRAPALGGTEVIPAKWPVRPFQLKVNGRFIRFAVFRSKGITYAVGRDLTAAQEALAGLRRSYLIALPLVVIAVAAGGWWIGHRAVAPIKTIAVRAASISVSDLNQRLPAPPAQDEIGHLTQVLNAMFDRLQRSFEQVTRFTSDASHEMKTPLALMRAEIEDALASSAGSASSRELLQSLHDQTSRLSQIIDGLLLLARADQRGLAFDCTQFDLVQLARELMEDAEILAEPARLTLEVELAGEVPVVGDRRLLARGVMNLIDNAIKHNHAAGRVAVGVAAHGDRAIVRVGNTGRGLPDGVGQEIFERFYRGDLSHSDETPGQGLGLSIAREIVRAHGGEVMLAEATPDWTEFCLVLPLASAS